MSAELTDADAQRAIQEAERILNPNRIPPVRMAERVREYRGVIMGTLGAVGGIAGTALVVALFPDQNSSFYNMFISPQQGMGVAGIAAGIFLAEALTR